MHLKLQNIRLSSEKFEIEGVDRHAGQPWVFKVDYPGQRYYISRVFYDPDILDLITAADEYPDATGDRHHIYLENYEVVSEPALNPQGVVPGIIRLSFGS